MAIYVTDGMFDGTGPLACLSSFSVMPWIRSDKCSYLMSNIPMSFMSRIKVPNKSLSHELNNVLYYHSDKSFETNVHCYLSKEYLRNW